MRQALAFWVTAPGCGELRAEVLPEPTSGQITVRTLYSGISRGTERLVFNGQIPASQYQLMRAPWQSGNFPFPVKYGYSNVGIVEQGPEQFLGQHVFCLYPHQDYYVIDATNVTPIPAIIPPHRAILAAAMETALNGLWDAAPCLGDRIAVIGAGTIGCLIAYLARQIPGCEVYLLDIDSRKAATATTLGIEFTTPEEQEQEQYQPADIIIHVSGSPRGLRTALSLAGFETSIIELSWYGNQEVTLPLGEAFHSQRLTIRGSQVSAIATRQRSRWQYQRRLQKVFDLLAADILDQLIDAESSFTDLPQTMLELSQVNRDTDSGLFCHQVTYEK